MEMSGIKSGASFSYRYYYAELKRHQEKDAEIHRLRQEKDKLKRRNDELMEQTQRSNEVKYKELESKVNQLQTELQDQDVDMIEAEKIIEVLMRDVQVAREVAARAEKAQREAEADQMLRHVLRDSDDEGTHSITLAQLRSELKRVTEAEQQSLRRVSELEEELTILRGTAEMLSVELQELKNARYEMERNEQEDDQELETTKIKVDESIEHWKEVANLRQELVAALQTQVKALRTDKGKLENAIALCQQSADKRLQILEHDRQNIEVENVQLLTELSSIRKELEIMNLKVCEFEEEGVSETAELKVELERRLAYTQTHQEQLTSRIVKVEQKLVMTTSTTEIEDGNQPKESEKQLMNEKQELLQQLEEERRQSKELKCSAAMLKQATESALKELKDVEIELRAISSDFSICGGQHESLVGLAKQVVAEFKRQDGASMEAVVASMQVQYLTSLMHAHLDRLCALREHRKVRCTSLSSSGSDSATESATANFDIVNSQDCYVRKALNGG
ncbi:unnamed protein product [Peronospora belbahrii]|nr:unnamed protein product [Peronospora belbahrii]